MINSILYANCSAVTSRAYQDTIKRLNSSASLGEAMKILDENTVMGSDPAAQSSFVDVVRRKFNINV